MNNHLTHPRFLLLFWCICISPLLGITQKYVIKNFTPQDYKAGIQNIDFAQNRDMTVFVANNLGVLSFNGTNWKTHDLNTGKKKRSLAFDENTNRLYVGSQGEFGFYMNNWDYVSLNELIPESAPDFDEVWDVYVLNDYIYFCTFSGIFIYDGEAIEVIIHEHGFDRCFLSDGRLIAQSLEGNLFTIDHAELNAFPAIDNLNQIVAGIVSIGEGDLIFYNSGLVRNTSSFYDENKFNILIRALNGTYVNHVLQISDGRLAISTQTSGIFIYDLNENTVEHVTTTAGLQSNACLRTFQDYSGNLWVGMQNGIAIIYTNSPLRFFNEEINLQGSGYESIKANGATYYSTSSGLYYQPTNTSKAIFIDDTEGPAYSFKKISGQLYAGHHSGVFQLNNGRARRIASTHGMWNMKQLQSRPEYFVGGTYSGLYLFKLDNKGELMPIDKIAGFNESSRFFEEDDTGNIWVGQYYKGLYKLELSNDLLKAEVHEFSFPENIPLDDQVILGKIDNQLFVATKKGLYKIEPEDGSVIKVKVFEEVIGEQQVYLFRQDNHNNVHIIAENLVGFFKQISKSNYRFVPSSLYHLRYYLNNDLLSLSSFSDEVLFSANEGFISYNPEMEDLISKKHPLVISNVYSVTQDTTYYSREPFDPKTETYKELIIDYRDKVLQIEVESFEYKDVGNQQFRFKLEGLDDEFSDWTANNIKEYTNLIEGDYTVTVQSRNYLGDVTSTEPLSFTVLPPFHRSFAAKILYAFLALVLLFLLSRLQKRKYTIETIKMEEEKNLKVAEEQFKILEIKRQKEKELMALKDEKQKGEIRHMENLLAASTMNLVAKNEFINMIKGQLNELKRKEESIETKNTLDFIVKEIDTTLRVKEDWEEFEFHFNQVHGDFLNRLRERYDDLTPNEQKLCTFLRLNLSTKEIANSMSISLRGVEVARYRLRKKLGLNQGENLSKFILEY